MILKIHKNSVDVFNGFVAYSDAELLFASMDDFENKFNEFVKSPKLNGLNHVMTFESFLRDKYSIDIM